MASTVVMLTTIDNPWNPLENYDSWFQFDVEKGYNSCSLLARIAKISDQMTEIEYAKEIDRAIDEIIKYDYMHVYKKLVLSAD